MLLHMISTMYRRQNLMLCLIKSRDKVHKLQMQFGNSFLRTAKALSIMSPFIFKQNMQTETGFEPSKLKPVFSFEPFKLKFVFRWVSN